MLAIPLDIFALFAPVAAWIKFACHWNRKLRPKIEKQILYVELLSD